MISFNRPMMRFTPPGQTEKIYLIEKPGYVERAQFRSTVVAAGIQQYSKADMRACIRQGIREQIVEDQQAELLAIVDASEAVEKGEIVDPEMARKIAVLAEDFGQNYEPFRRMLAANAMATEAIPQLAVATFLSGYEGIEVPFKKHYHLRYPELSDETLAAIPPDHLTLIAGEVLEMIVPTRREPAASATPMEAPPVEDAAVKKPPRQRKTRAAHQGPG